MTNKFSYLGKVLSKQEQKKISGGFEIVICGGEGNYVESCGCSNSQGTLIGPFYCCHNGQSQCITDNCGANNQGWACAH